MRQVRYHEPRDAREGPERKHRSERPSRQGKEEALRQQLPHETPPAGADGQPERHLFVAHGSSREQKRSEEHTSELQSRLHLVCRLLLEKKRFIICEGSIPQFHQPLPRAHWATCATANVALYYSSTLSVFHVATAL